MNRTKRIAIVLRMSGAAGRDILSGIFHFTRSHHHWHTRLFQMPDEFTPENFQTEKANGLDGIIASEPGPDETARLLRDSNVPVAFIGDPGPTLSARKTGMAYIRNNDIYIGGMGARYLVSLGNRRAYGFVPTVSHQYWSTDRYVGFKQELNKRGLECSIFHSPATAGTHEDLSALKVWLTDLPKPCAVMAAWDTRATQVIQICNEAHVKIPDQLAILGVDNDELLDEATTPPLSSILPDHEKLGYVAARELESLMRGSKCLSDVVFRARPKQLVERESANTSAPAAHLITRAMSYINRNATKGITVNDVVTFLGVSRRLADLRFQQFAGETINAAIVRVRLDAVKKLLATTTRPIHTISEACGYSDLTYLKKLFKKHFGVTMREWRKRN